MKFSRFNVIVDDLENDRILLNNSLSGETFEVDTNIKNAIINNSLELVDREDYDILYKNRFILDDEDYDIELKNVEFFHNKEKYDDSTLNITLLLTMNCNLRCVYCYEAAGIISCESLDENKYNAVYKFIISQLEYRGSRNLSICLFGGESTIELKNSVTFLEKIRNYCKKNNINFFTSIVTNGTLIDFEVIDILKTNNCLYEQITVDGTKEFHDNRRVTPTGMGSYDKTIDGIKQIVNSDLPNPVIRVNIDRTNYENVFLLLEDLADENLNCCNIDYGIVKSNTPSCERYKTNCFSDEELPVILKNIWDRTKELGFKLYNNPTRKFLFCGMYSDSAFTINPNLDLYKCWDLVNQKEHKIGRIDKDGMFVDVTSSYFNWMTRTPILINECKDCKYLPVCGGGCASMAKFINNKYREPGCYKVKGVYELEVLNRFNNENV